MFVSISYLKGLIIDLDTFKYEHSKWLNIHKGMKLLFFSTNQILLNNIEQLDQRNFYLANSNPFQFVFNIGSFLDFFSILNLRSHEVAFVSNSLERIQLLQKHLPIGTIYISKSQSLNYNDVGKLPDIICQRIEEINIIRNRKNGYLAEVAAESTVNKARLEKLQLVKTELDNDHCFTILSGGRYFNTKDPRSSTHQLSKRILKSKDNQLNNTHLFVSIYIELLNLIKEADSIARIPPRKGKPDRFYKIINSISKTIDIRILNCLKCVKDYPSQKLFSSIDRTSNVKGAFVTDGSVKGRNIVLLDDIVSSGATFRECATELYKNNAEKVTLITLGVNQFHSSWRFKYHKKILCKECDGHMVLRFNSKKTNKPAFFGCSNYYSKNKCKFTLNYSYGLNEYFQATDLTNLTNEDFARDLDISF